MRSRLARIPKSGMIVPEMGTRSGAKQTNGIAAALFTPVQRRVLGLLFGQPQRRFGSGELIRAVGSGTGAAHRQLQRLSDSGLVTVSRIGNQKYYQANGDSPVYPELHGLIVKTVGLIEPLRIALAPIAKKIELAFVFGSIAKGTEKADSDIDLLVVSDSISYPDLYEAIQSAEGALSRPVNPTLMKPEEWRRKRSGQDSFARRIAQQPKLFVIGDERAGA